MAHGESNYAMFTGVLKNYMELRRDGEIAVLNQYLADLLGCMTNVVYDELEKLLDQILPKRPLREYGVTREVLPVFCLLYTSPAPKPRVPADRHEADF